MAVFWENSSISSDSGRKLGDLPQVGCFSQLPMTLSMGPIWLLYWYVSFQLSTPFPGPWAATSGPIPAQKPLAGSHDLSGVCVWSSPDLKGWGRMAMERSWGTLPKPHRCSE